MSLSPEEATKDSPLKVKSFKEEGTPQHFYDLNRNAFSFVPDEKQVRTIINSLDNENRWLIKHAPTSNPYIGDSQKSELTDEFASKNVGDETDTSPYPDQSDQQYISTGTYIRNMNSLISYIKSVKTSESNAKSINKK